MKGVQLISPLAYTGGNFLDERQGNAATLEELKNWDVEAINIPDGFEVYCQDKWYTYNSENAVHEHLGKFRERNIESHNVKPGTGEKSLIVCPEDDIEGTPSAEGESSIAIGSSASIYGTQNPHIAKGYLSTVIGTSCSATEAISVAIGVKSIASAPGALAIGYEAEATGMESIALGGSIASGDYSFAATGGQASGFYSVAFGGSEATEHGAFAINAAKALGMYSFASGNSEASGNYAHTEGFNTKATGIYAHAEGYGSISSGTTSHAEGYKTTASGNFSHAEGSTTESKGVSSHAEGGSTEAIGAYSHAEGLSSIASGDFSHAEGGSTEAIGNHSHAEGSATTAAGVYAHAEGWQSSASRDAAHAEGGNTLASGYYSHSEGILTEAKGMGSHAEGFGTIATKNFQHVQGQYNIEDTEDKYADIVGGGVDEDDRKNIQTLDWEGNAWSSGKYSQDGTPTEPQDLATKAYVDANVGGGGGSIVVIQQTEADITLANNTQFTYAESPSEINISLPTGWTSEGLALITFTTGETATQVSFPSGINVKGSIEASKSVEINIYNNNAIILNV